MPDGWESQDRADFIKNFRLLGRTAALGWVIFAVRNAAFQYTYSAWVCIITSVGTLLLQMLVDGRRPEQPVRWLVHLALLLNVLGISGIAMMTGQADSRPLTFLTLIPLFAAYQLGNRATLAWAGICGLAILGVHLSGHWITLTVEFNPQGWNQALDQWMMLFVVAAFSTQSRQVNERRVRLLREQSQLVEQARDQALKLVDMKSAFLANVSHEIRTPLHGVMGLTEILSHSQLSQADRQTVDSIRNSGQHLLTIVNDVLDFSRLEKGPVSIHLRGFEVFHLLDTVVQLNLANARYKNIDLRMEIGPQVPPLLLGDSNRLQQVLTNLTSNAIKFTKQGEVVVRVQAQLKASGGTAMLSFSVSDSGIGISPDNLPRLFRPFEQLDASITREYGGSGLGLAICQSILQQMSSVISVESQVGEGSRFVFEVELPVLVQKKPLLADITFGLKIESLPPSLAQSYGEILEHLGARQLPADGSSSPNWWLSDHPSSVAHSQNYWVGDPDQCPQGFALLRMPFSKNQLELMLDGRLTSENDSQPPQATDNPSSSSAPAKCLVVEDNPTNQKVILGFLKRLGLAANLADNGQQALELIQNSPRQFQLLLMDLQMPVLDGLQATERIRALPEIAQPYIVIITANAFEEARQVAEKVGANEVLTKPLRLAQLQEAVQRYQSQATSSPVAAS